ncbi:Piso0_004131 [Millerozyma farinosa CBS 7064]|uniref:inorganic diphosphatase n=1 Tax=Pichia sorbitophila (strain ATCC MYA-4447 / BCRC 22081 / CBS 7064 / NBRC 10061 / NRRL Y-12695) TaxID=559304 RepID=G8YAG9_PICSO|nr:Piso0_004131 [Millerozyma farinosa CBS 7064]CCE84583.1 Piso0_004131 [Millerozyma farinosa CBS 7064]
MMKKFDAAFKSGPQLRSLGMARALDRLALSKQHLNPTGNFTPAASLSSLASLNEGTKYSPDFKKYSFDESTGKVISYFHDVPLGLDTSNRTANMIAEIPRWSNAKFEINAKLPGNPITQDVKDGKVRFVKNLFPYHGYVHNYGAFPQTWEDPTTKDRELSLYGDNDPLDVCDIGDEVLETGAIKRVKILGSMALVDSGELDWKIIVINVDDPMAKELHDIHDVYVRCPGLLEATRQWFRFYKVPDGKPKNHIAFNGKFKTQQETVELLEEYHSAWKRLVSGETKGEGLPNISNTTLENTPGFTSSLVNPSSLKKSQEPPADIPSDVNLIYYSSND